MMRSHFSSSMMMMIITLLTMMMSIISVTTTTASSSLLSLENNNININSNNDNTNIPLGQDHSFPVANAYLTQAEVSDLFMEFYWNTYFLNITNSIDNAWVRFKNSWSVHLFHACPKKETAGSQVFQFDGISYRPRLGDLTIKNQTYNITVQPGGRLQITGLIDWRATTNTSAFGVQGNCPVGNGDCSCATGSIDFLCCGQEDIPNRKCLSGVEVSIHSIYNASLVLEFQPTPTGFVNILPTSTVSLVESEIVYPCQSILNPSSIQEWLFASNKTFMNNLTTSLLHGQELIREAIQVTQLEFTEITLRAAMKRQITQQYQVPSGMWVSYFITHFWSEYENFFTIFVNGSFSFVSSSAGWQEFFNASLCQKTQENPPSLYPSDIKSGIRISSAVLQAIIWAAYVDGTFHMFNRHKVVDAEVLLRLFVTEPVTDVPQNEELHMHIGHGSGIATCVSEIDHRNKTLIEASFSNVDIRGGIRLKTVLPLTIYGKVHNFNFRHAQFRIEKPTGGFPRKTLQRIIEKGLNESIPAINWGLARTGFSLPSVTQYLMTPAETHLDLFYRPDITCAFGTQGPDQGYAQLAKEFAPTGPPSPTPMPARPTVAPGEQIFQMIVALFKRDANHNSTVRRGTACDPSVTGNTMINTALIVDEKYFSSANAGQAASSLCQPMITTAKSQYFFKFDDVILREMQSGQYRYFPGRVRLLCTSGDCETETCLYVGPVTRPDDCVWLDPFNNASSNMNHILNFSLNGFDFDALAMGVVPGQQQTSSSSSSMNSEQVVEEEQPPPENTGVPNMMCVLPTIMSSAQYRQPSDVAERIMMSSPSCGLQENAFWISSVAVHGPRSASSSSSSSTNEFVTFYDPPFGQLSNRNLYVGVDVNENLYYCRSPFAMSPSTLKIVCVEPPLSLPAPQNTGTMSNPKCVSVEGQTHFPNSSIKSYFMQPNQVTICPVDFPAASNPNRGQSELNIQSDNFIWPLLGGSLVVLVLLGVLFAVLRICLRKRRLQKRIDDARRRIWQRRSAHHRTRRLKRNSSSKPTDAAAEAIGRRTQSNDTFITDDNSGDDEKTNDNIEYDDNTAMIDDEAEAYRRQKNKYLHEQPGEVWTQAEKTHSLSCLVAALSFFILGLFWSDPFERISMDSARGLGIPDIVDISPMADYFRWWSNSLLRSTVLVCASGILLLGAWPFAGPLSVDYQDHDEEREDNNENDDDEELKSLKKKEGKNENKSENDEDQTLNPKSSSVSQIGDNNDHDVADENKNEDIDFDEIEEKEVEKIRRSYPAFGDESFWRHLRSHALSFCICTILLVLIFPLFKAPLRSGTFVEKLGSKNSIIGGKTTHDEIVLLSSLATTLAAAPIVLNLICMFLTAIPVGTLLGLILHDFVYGEDLATLSPAIAATMITSRVDFPRPINNKIAHAVFVQLIISILLPLVVLIFIFCMFQSTQSTFFFDYHDPSVSETWLHTWGIYILLNVTTSAILLMRVLFRYGPATIILIFFCITDFALIARINKLSEPFLGNVASTTFTLFHLCIVIVDAIALMEAPSEGSKKARWYHKVADFLFKYIMNPFLGCWYAGARATKSFFKSCWSKKGKKKQKSRHRRENGDGEEESSSSSDDEDEERTVSMKMKMWISQKKENLLIWEDEYFTKLAAEEKKKEENSLHQTSNDDHDDVPKENNVTTDATNEETVGLLASSSTYGTTGEENNTTTASEKPSAAAAEATTTNNNNNNNNNDDDAQPRAQNEEPVTNTIPVTTTTTTTKSKLIRQREKIIRRIERIREKNRALQHAFATQSSLSETPVVQYSAATAFLRFCRDYVFMEKTGATAETAPVFGFRPWWRRLAGLICCGCFIYLVIADSESVHETVRMQLIDALNSTLEFPSNISKIHLSIDPGLQVYQTAMDQQYTYTLVTTVLIGLANFFDWFFPNKTGLYISKVFYGLGFFCLLTSLLSIATPNYVQACGLANAVPYCAPHFYKDGVWILSTTSGLFFALLVLSQLAPVLIALAPTLARLLWLVASLTKIFDSRWLLIQIGIFTPVTVFLPLLGISKVTNFGPVITVSSLLIFFPVALAGLAYAFRIRSIAFVSVSLIWVVIFIFLWIDLGIKVDEWDPWFMKYLIKLLSHAKFYCELFAELCLTAICSSDLILHLLRDQVSGDTHSIPPRQQQLSYFKPTLNPFLDDEKQTKISGTNNKKDDNDDDDDDDEKSFFEVERSLVMHSHLLLQQQQQYFESLAKMRNENNNKNGHEQDNDAEDEEEKEAREEAILALREQIFENRKLHQYSRSSSIYLDDEDGRKIGFWNSAAILSPAYILYKRTLMEQKRTLTSESSLHVSPFVVDCLCDAIRGRIYSGILREGLLRKEVFNVLNFDDDHDDDEQDYHLNSSRGARDEHHHHYENLDGNNKEEEREGHQPTQAASSSILRNSMMSTKNDPSQFTNQNLHHQQHSKATTTLFDFDDDEAMMKRIQGHVLILDATNWKFFTSNNEDEDFWKNIHKRRIQKTSSFLPKWRIVIGIIQYAEHHFASFKYDHQSHKLVVCESNHGFLAEHSPAFMHAMAKLVGTDSNPGSGFLKKLFTPPLELLPMMNKNNDSSNKSSSAAARLQKRVAVAYAKWSSPPPTFFLSVTQVAIEESAYASVNDMMLMAGSERGNMSQTKVLLLCETLLEEQESEVDPLPDKKWSLNACRLI